MVTGASTAELAIVLVDGPTRRRSVLLPTGHATRVEEVIGTHGRRDEAEAGESVTLVVADDRDLARGDMIVRPMNLPEVGTEVDAPICGTSTEPMRPGASYWLRHTTREMRAFVSRLVWRIDVDTLHREPVDRFELNDNGRVQITTTQPLFFDRYDRNRETGSFILVDPETHDTVAAGMIRGAVRSLEDMAAPDPAHPHPVSPDVVRERWNVPLPEREAHNGHRAAVVWLTGLPASGRSSMAGALE